MARKIGAEVDERLYAQAIESLKDMRRSDDGAFRANNYDYLLARLSEKTGDAAGAAAGYLPVAAGDSALKEYGLWHFAELMRGSGNLVIERIYLQQLSLTSPDSLFREAAEFRLAESLFESGDFPAAIARLQNFRRRGESLRVSAPRSAGDTRALAGNHPRVRAARLMLARALAQNKQLEEARQTFAALVDDIPDPAMPDDFALEATRGLDQLSGFGSAQPAAALEEAEHVKRAATYTFNRDFAAARAHYKAIIERYPQSAAVPNALFQIGRGLMQEGFPDQALPWFERVQAEYPRDAVAADALSQAAAAYARVKKTNEALARYQKFIAQYPDAASLDRAYLNIIDVLRDDGELTKALEWCETTRAKFNGKIPAALALFSKARIYITQNDWTRALAVFDELREAGDLGGVRVPGGTSKAEIAFLRALALEKLARFGEAANEYLAITDGRGEYYGWRATERLKIMAKNQESAAVIAARLAAFRSTATEAISKNQHEPARRDAQTALRLTADVSTRADLMDIVRRCYAALPAYKDPASMKMPAYGRKNYLTAVSQNNSADDAHQAIADELLFLGLYDEGVPELEYSLRRKASLPLAKVSANPLSEFPPETAYALAQLYLRADIPYRSVAYVEPLWRKTPDDHLAEVAARDYVEMLYPAPYREALLAEAGFRSVDPRFLLSIMRQESRYRPGIKSNAAARGLMQFISATADTTAKQLGKNNFDQNELYHAETAIEFGAEYTKTIFDMFPAQPDAVAASYNGGETNMARWLKRSHSNDPDLYVPEIAFSQSKDYVHKVMANYRVYCRLYDEGLKPTRAQ